MLLLSAMALAAFVGCTKEKSSGTTGGTRTTADDHDHEHDGDHEHDEHVHGPLVALGTTTVGGWTVTVSADEEELASSSELLLELITSGGTDKIKAVRAWVGSEDGAGALKALAEMKSPTDPDHWHTHVEVPRPLPDGAKLWVELELETAGKVSGSVELKR
jgi:hypothetical protein